MVHETGTNNRFWTIWKGKVDSQKQCATPKSPGVFLDRPHKVAPMSRFNETNKSVPEPEGISCAKKPTITVPLYKGPDGKGKLFNRRIFQPHFPDTSQVRPNLN